MQDRPTTRASRQHRVLRIATAAALAAALPACQTPYQPAAGSDVAKLRLRLVPYELFSIALPVLRPVLADGRCGKAAGVEALSYAVANDNARRVALPNEVDRPKRLRAEMADSPPPEQSDVTELRLEPGRYVLLVTAGSVGPQSQCYATALLDLQARQQYQVSFGYDLAQKRCTVQGTQWQPGRSDAAAQVQWMSAPFLTPDKSCP